MSSLRALNDYFMVEIEKNPQGFIDNLNVKEEGIMCGRVVSMSEDAVFYGMNTYAFDRSLMDIELLGKIQSWYKDLIGKKVWWPLRTESGSVVEIDGKQYVFVKWSALMCVEDDK